MDTFIIKTLHPATIKHALLGHPWITKDSISSKWPKDKILLHVHLNPQKIYTYLHDPKHPFCCARFFSTEKITDLAQLKIKIKKNILSSIQKRLQLKIIDQRNHFIIIFGEVDELPGLFVTYLNQRILIQTQMNLWDEWINDIQTWIENACQETKLPVESFWWQSRSSNQTNAKCFVGGKFITKQESFLVDELNFKMNVNLGSRYDHGIYSDMAGIRFELAKNKELWHNKSILNLFSYTGAYTMMSFALGAKYCCSIDVSSTYQEFLNQNLKLNFPESIPHKTMTCDIMDGLKQLIDQKKSFDLVILDPPSSFTSKNKKTMAMQIYPEILKRVEKITSDHGSILCFLNHHQTTRSKFETMLKSSLPHWSITEKIFSIQDAPQLPYFPEGDYLKGALLRRKK